MRNTPTRYGPVTKTFHWLLFLLILTQFVVAAVMLTMPAGELVAGFTQGSLYEWHKSIGLVALTFVVLRFLWRKMTPLPDWAPNLSGGEQRTIHYVERVLYACMFLMPLSGFLFVMAGGFGVKLFDVWDLPRFIGEQPLVARAAQLTHATTASVLALALFAHWGVVLRHESLHSDGYLRRMLPFTHQR